MIKIAVLGPSDIAFRRTIPAFVQSKNFQFAGVAVADAEERGWNTLETETRLNESIEKAKEITRLFGGRVYNSYGEVLDDNSIDAVYLPLPPALHFSWTKKALEHGKHCFVEKPFAVNSHETNELVQLAESNGLAVHENFAFLFHRQIEEINEIVQNGEIGDVRLIRTAFGFPYRGENDFRYHKSMGGGALLDCGGYPIRLANYLLGGESRVVVSNLSTAKGHDVDVFGSATLVNNNNAVAQIAFGMDNSYKCELELWGSKGVIFAPRIFTPPADMRTEIFIKTNSERNIQVFPDDQFMNSADFFAMCIKDKSLRVKNYQDIRIQSSLTNTTVFLSKGEKYE